MRYTSKQYATALYDATQDLREAQLDAALDKFVQMLTDKNEMYMLGSIMKAYRTILTKKNINPEAHITTAQEISDDVKQDLLKNLDISLDTTIKSHVDPEMIGGAFVKYNNRFFDLSLGRRLARLGAKLGEIK